MRVCTWSYCILGCVYLIFLGGLLFSGGRQELSDSGAERSVAGKGRGRESCQDVLYK